MLVIKYKTIKYIMDNENNINFNKSMQQPTRQMLDMLASKGQLSPHHVEQAALTLDIYPNKQRWYEFIRHALLVLGFSAAALSLVFFVAYNWFELGKMGKFVLVQSAMVLTIAGYVYVAAKRNHPFIESLLLFVVSLITGALLALVGQVYQTGADTWQLFFNWALLIIPWVWLARLPALWLLWLGLLNAALMLYLDVASLPFDTRSDASVVKQMLIAGLNFSAFILWRAFDGGTFRDKSLTSDATLSAHRFKRSNWALYVVAGICSFAMTLLAVRVVTEIEMVWMLPLFAMWLLWVGLMLRWYRYQQVDLFMLTCVCMSVIAVVMFLLARFIADHNAGTYLLLALILVGLSSGAVMWLKNLDKLDVSK